MSGAGDGSGGYVGRRRANGAEYRSRSAPARSSAHLIVACLMFGGIVAAGVLLDRAGREPEAIMATLSFYSATGIALVTALAKLSGIQQTGEIVERRTNGETRAMVREEIRAALEDHGATRRPSPRPREGEQ